jgi:hypothetical protein
LEHSEEVLGVAFISDNDAPEVLQPSEVVRNPIKEIETAPPLIEAI